MYRSVLKVFVFALLLVSCRDNKREQELDARETGLNTREQELLLREKTLQMREEQLLAETQRRDSIRNKDTAAVVVQTSDTSAHMHTNPELVGEWTVKMSCIETNCPGSAVGDTRVEQWNLSYTGNHLVAKAMDHGNLIRTYSGIFRPGNIQLIEHRDSAMVYDTRMVVRLRPIDENSMEGQREIVMENECKIVYALTLDKTR
jgi:hypothetical protein